MRADTLENIRDEDQLVTVVPARNRLEPLLLAFVFDADNRCLCLSVHWFRGGPAVMSSGGLSIATSKNIPPTRDSRICCQLAGMLSYGLTQEHLV